MFELIEFMLQVSPIEISCNNIVCLICVGDKVKLHVFIFLL
jgi:hypothetical protein